MVELCYYFLLLAHVQILCFVSFFVNSGGYSDKDKLYFGLFICLLVCLARTDDLEDRRADNDKEEEGNDNRADTETVLILHLNTVLVETLVTLGDLTRDNLGHFL